MEQLRGKGRWPVTVMKGLILSGLMSVLLLLLLAFVMLKLQPGPEIMEAAIFGTYALSCFAGGWYCGKKANRRKYLWGLLLGTVYYLLVLAFSGMGSEGVSCSLVQGFISLVLCSIGGMVGGMAA